MKFPIEKAIKRNIDLLDDFINRLQTIQTKGETDRETKSFIEQSFFLCSYFSNSIFEFIKYILEQKNIILDSSVNNDSQLLRYFKTLIDAPNEVYEFINIVRITRNRLIHEQIADKDTVKLLINFIEAYCLSFSYLLNRFYNPQTVEEKKAKTKLNDLLRVARRYTYLVKNDNYRLSKSTNDVDINSNSKVNDILYNLKVENERLKEENRFLREENEELRGNGDLVSLFNSNKIILEEIRKIGIDVKEVKDTVEDLSKSIDSILEILKENKEDISKMLSKADSYNDDDKIEEIISNFADRIAIDFVNKLNKNSIDEQYKIEETVLKNLFSEEYWNKLDDNSKEYLITGKILYNKLVSSDKGDYSGVCLLITKAVDNELHRFLYTKFKNYLENRYPFESCINKWPSFLYKQNKRGIYYVLPDYDFTLGSVAYFCCDKIYLDSNENQINKEIMYEFCRNELMKKEIDDFNISENLKFISDSAEKTRLDFRNPAAHVSSMSKIKADECLDYILETTKILIELMKIFR